MARTKYKKKEKNGNVYFFHRLRHKNLRKPRDIYGKTVAELEEKIKKIEYELDRGVTSEKAYFGVYMDRWLNTIHIIGKKQGTVKRYLSIYEKHIKDKSICNIQLKNLTALDVQDHYSKLVAEGISKNTLEFLSLLINGCIRYAYGQEKIIKDFTRFITIPDAKQKQENARRASRALLPEEEEKLLKACNGDPFEILILTALNSGLRLGELLALSWEDIDLDKQIINVTKTYSQKFKDNPVGTPKTQSSIRQVPIPSFLIKALKNHKLSQNKNRLLYANKYENKNLVFCNDIGNYLSSTTISRKLKLFAEKSKIASINMHDFRDTYATKLYYETRDLKMIQILLGHSTLATTADIYTQVSVDEASKYVKILDAMQLKTNV